MQTIKQYLPYTTRVLVAIMFLVSGIVKSGIGAMDPVWIFEKQLIDVGVATWDTAPIFARLIIALELAIGIGILQNHWLKRFVIPITAFVLIAFCVQLSYTIYVHGNNGNCGCFGNLIPMTPVQAIIKNVIALAMLVYIFKTSQERPKGKNNFLIPLGIYAVCAAFIFFMSPMKSSSTTDPNANQYVVPENIDGGDTTNTTVPSNTSDTVVNPTNPTSNSQVEPEEQGPAAKKSKYAAFTQFGNKKVNLDQGKKLVCCFAPGCEHCLETATIIAEMQKKGGMPEVYILFMDEEPEKIPDFFKTSKIKAQYRVLDIPAFWTLMGSFDTPAVSYMWNGNILYESNGIAEQQFDQSKLQAAIKK
jgi:thiol-disulfide isomerase/thioredoxin